MFVLVLKIGILCEYFVHRNHHLNSSFNSLSVLVADQVPEHEEHVVRSDANSAKYSREEGEHLLHFCASYESLIRSRSGRAAQSIRQLYFDYEFTLFSSF